jgi:hypothetical protein
MEKELKARDKEALRAYLNALSWEKEDEFNKYFLKRLSDKYAITREPAHCYSILTVRFGIVMFYPKLNRCFLMRKQRWIKPGLQWVIKNLLK